MLESPTAENSSAGKSLDSQLEKQWHWNSLSETAALLKSGDLSALELTEHMLARVESLNPSLHCYCNVLAEAAVERAKALDARRARGDALGALHGVPIGLKDLLNTRGVTTASGTTVMANHIPETDATVVARLEEAGAIALGKLQLTEGAYGEHHPSITPPVNPWNKDLWSGVSSSGSGVSVASGLAFAALGSDTGGSIRFPSVANGVVGIKPTYGRVSRTGAFPLGESLDHIGPITRTVEDAARMLQVIAGHDPSDPNSLSNPVPDFTCSFNEPVKGMRFGVDWKYVEEGVSPEVVATLKHAVSVLTDLGAEVCEVTVPAAYRTLVRNWVVTCGVECALAHEGMFPEHKEQYGADLTNLIEFGRKVGGLQYGALERVRERFRRELDDMLAPLDGLLCPAMPSPVPTVAAMESRADEPEQRAEFVTFTAPFNYSGHPTLSLPTGLDASGRPEGFQIVGGWLREARLIQAGQALEREFGFKEHASI